MKLDAAGAVMARDPNDEVDLDPSRGDVDVVFAALFDKYAAALHKYLARRVGNAIADDLVSETFLAAFVSRNSYDVERGAVRGWLYGIASNLLSKHVRSELRVLAKEHRSYALEVEAQSPQDAATDRIDALRHAQQLSSALTALSARDRDVLLLKAWAELDLSEISVALNIPIGTVRSRMHRIRQQIRKADELAATSSED